VGKTTCAVSVSIYLSINSRTLLVSTDPAHSVSDSLGQAIGDNVKEVKGINNLSAIEMNADKVLLEFKIKYNDKIRKILNTSTNLDKEDINMVFDLAIPGMNELMGLKTIIDFIEEGKYDKYVVDTAPTGHALQLLTGHEMLDDWIKVMAKLRWKYRYIIERFSGGYKQDDGDDFLISMKKTVEKLKSLLKDSQRCEFIPVTIPEDMSIAETERLITRLALHGIKVRQLVINNVLEVSNCEFFMEKMKKQQENIKNIRNKFSDLLITIIPLQRHEVKDMENLKSFKEILCP